MRKLTVILVLCLLAGIGYAATIRVPQDQPTIQAGIDAASAGDMVEVAAGVYSENITLKDGIQLVGAGDDETRITASEGNVITLDNVTEVTIEGFTIDGQNQSKYGIYCVNFDLEHEAPTEVQPSIKIQGNLITNIWGDGIFCFYSSPIISNNLITEVTSSGIYAHWRHPVIENNTVTHAGRYGIQCQSGSLARLTGNRITDIGGQGILCGHDSAPLIEGNTITRTASHGIECYNNSKPVLIGNHITHALEDGVNCNGKSWTKLRENVIQHNLGNGVFCDKTSLANLGSETNPGLNQISNNTEYNVKNENSWELQAKGNWWGQAPPNENGFQGLVDYKPWLNSPPSDTTERRPAEIPIPRWDVNEDGIVDMLDLVLVASHFGESTIPAAMAAMRLSVSNRSQMLDLLAELEGLENQPHGTQIVIDFLRSLLNPEPVITETKVFTNYPNPFNPETWIPYQLAAEADVEISIYSVGGQRIRTLQLGMQPSGEYITREKAAYWDGHTDRSERVPSGAYFYHFRAGDYSATRKMLILK